MEEGISPTFAPGVASHLPNTVWKGTASMNLPSQIDKDSSRSKSPPEMLGITSDSARRGATGAQLPSVNADTLHLNFSFQKTGESTRINVMRPVLSPSTEATLQLQSQSHILETVIDYRRAKAKSMESFSHKDLKNVSCLLGITDVEGVAGVIPESPSLKHPFQCKISKLKQDPGNSGAASNTIPNKLKALPKYSITSPEPNGCQFPSALRDASCKGFKISLDNK